MENPITLNDFLGVVNAKRVLLHAPLTPRMNSQIYFNPDDSAILDDIISMFGSHLVASVDVLEEPLPDAEPCLEVCLA